ncbi:ABC transporter substrate-binding protein [Actinospica robiniae]|uniref:ABC transporter substrate-binding protein n=1 Tax=Actinospica robiniae TaxID=304901 RepID=UPI00146F9C06|nr:ABC transporter substrate-binding protein [Actinospica robiniae]
MSPADVTAVIQRGVYDSLVYQDSSGAFHPWLATSWKVSKDGKTYTFQLRHDVKFTDGTAFDAQAVKANFDSINAPATKSEYASALFGQYYQGTKVDDAYTVEVDFSRAFTPFLQAVSTTYLGIASPASLTHDASHLCAGGSYSVGSGPFVESARVPGQSVSFTRNPAYKWGPQGVGNSGPAYLSGYTIDFLPDDSTRVGSLTSGQVDAATVPVTAVKTVKADTQLTYVAHQSPGIVYSLQLNQAHAPLNDERVRQAVLDAADVPTLIKSVYFGLYQPAWSVLSPSTPGGTYDSTLANSWGNDPAKAIELLEQASYTGVDAQGYRTKDGKRLTLRWIYIAESQSDQRDTLGQALVAQFKKVGIDLERDTVAEGAYFTDIEKSDYDVLDLSWARGDADILRGFYHSASAAVQGSEDASNTRDPQVDAWLDDADGNVSPAQSAADYRDVQNWTIQHAVVLPLYVTEYQLGVSTKVHGLRYDVSGGPEFYTAWVA